jgi:hypothetical protein
MNALRVGTLLVVGILSGAMPLRAQEDVSVPLVSDLGPVATSAPQPEPNPPSPSDVVTPQSAVPAPAAPATVAPPLPAADACAGTMLTLSGYGCCEVDPCAPPGPWHLPQPCLFQTLGIKVGGWVQAGMTANSTNPTDRFNSVTALNDRDREFQMNQFWVYLIKPVDQAACHWQVGGRTDIVYGSDWRYGRFFGLEERINGDTEFYGLVMPQFYLEIGGYDLSVKLGHMAGPLGYEIVPAVANPFYSHALAMCYTEPQLVTGLWADYKFSDHWSFQAGFHRGWFMFEDEDSNLDVMGGIQWTSCDKRTSIRYALTSGDNRGLLPVSRNWYASSLVIQHQFTEKFKYVLQHNLGVMDILAPANDAEWYGLNQYFLYALNERWTAGLRVEWLRDADGMRVVGVGNLGMNRGWKGLGYAGDFYEITAGLNWKAHPNVMFRPELRWDWYEGASSPVPGAPVRPFKSGTGDEQLTAACDVLITF